MGILPHESSPECLRYHHRSGSGRGGASKGVTVPYVSP
ncbi:hypothetical protein PACID_30830 [Acidipropionibacterium acidipropionici ATCC 4875]|uniref:Uncharacterized protein n=1 Tax=Acidipropionibacterium acidipropionici (strain ATCC 4875 / DSM 20272 / JCM 6432 / NBRC 12425 / NCIMB 8070 / 4) TaxID=1171373 RepID=K7RS44_ACIA4|nr:hypothetical protein PACID_30830 [Acidipropionibacterium acidipropionici ATCC 4875]